ncbi:glycosyltransferase [Dermatophilaceae bacterium Sec6.4]
MAAPLLSVVVPYYGVQDYIAPCLESIRVQRLQDIEVIMVDDGSLDASVEVAREYAERDERFRIVTKVNGGLGPARNTGTGEATGQYLTFIDSDDLVSRSSFELMVASLERSSSSFALCNARRFSRTSGVRQSWTHNQICQTTVAGTDIFEAPALVRDRMVWNKVYRRTFWDEYGYEFPPIRYEDYPVTLGAHLDAVTVDIISAHGYYWRERESGDSITQQVFRYDNLLDRVISAEMVLDLADRKGTPQIRENLHWYLAGIDLAAMCAAFAVVPDEDVENLLLLGHRLTSRLRFDVSARPRIDQIQYHALRAGDVPLLRELARFRDGGGLTGGVALHRSLRRPWRYDAAYPGRGRSTAPDRAFSYPLTALKLSSAVTQLRWDGDDLVIQGRVELAHFEPADDYELKISAVCGISRSPLAVTRRRTRDLRGGIGNVGFETRVNVSALARRSDMVWPLRFEVELTNGGIRRVGPLTGLFDGSPRYPPSHPLGADALLQPASSQGGMLAVFRVYAPTTVSQVVADGNDLVVRGTIPERCNEASLQVGRARPLLPVSFPVTLEPQRGTTSFEVRVPAAQVLDGDHADDPFTLASVRSVELITDIGPLPLSWPHYLRDIEVAVAGEVVTLTRTPFGLMRLTHGPARPSAYLLAANSHGTDEMVVARGVVWPGVPVTGMAWRRYLPGSDDFVEIGCDYDAVSGEFTATADQARLIPAVDEPVTPGAPAADWTLFAHIDSGDFPVLCQPGAATGLPHEIPVSGRMLFLTTVADTLRAQVR